VQNALFSLQVLFSINPLPIRHPQFAIRNSPSAIRNPQFNAFDPSSIRHPQFAIRNSMLSTFFNPQFAIRNRQFK